MLLTKGCYVVSVQSQRLALIHCDDACDARGRIDERQFPEDLSGAEQSKNPLIPEWRGDPYGHMALDDEVQRVPWVTLVEDNLLASELAASSQPEHVSPVGFGKSVEEAGGHAAVWRTKSRSVVASKVRRSDIAAGRARTRGVL
jgi:hypothetical protein